MAINIIEIGLSFIEGLALIASPCILPVLPITLSASIESGKARPYGIILGFILCFSFFALGTATVLRSLSIDLDLLKTISLVLLALFGLMLIFKPLFAIFEALTQRLNNVALINIKQKNGFISGVFIGGLIGLVWTPCAGPILASALIQVIRQESSLNSLLLVVSFSLGVSIPMLMIALIGRDIVIRLGFLQKNAQAIRMILGVLILLSVVYMMSGYQWFTFASKTEEQPIQSQSMELINPLTIPYKAPDFEGISAWLNSTPLTMASLKGKVVLIDFWTYSCINCIRTLPYITAWDKKYREDGLVIVGVHSPEFEFERKTSNIEDAIKRFGIKYPVAVDNGLNTWQAYHNLYWPAHYLIDKSGQVVYTHFGEGAYNITEHNIKVLLDKNKASNTIEASENSPFETKSPETYLGYFRFEHFANASQFEKDKTQLYHFPDTLSLNQWALSGLWKIEGEKALSQGNDCALKFHFKAKKVFLVMGSKANHPISVNILLNNQLVAIDAGMDVIRSRIQVNEYRLYELISQPVNSQGMLEIRVNDPNLEIYAFTFG